MQHLQDHKFQTNLDALLKQHQQRKCITARCRNNIILFNTVIKKHVKFLFTKHSVKFASFRPSRHQKLRKQKQYILNTTIYLLKREIYIFPYSDSLFARNFQQEQLGLSFTLYFFNLYELPIINYIDGHIFKVVSAMKHFNVF